jgi:hypothetical protein
MQHQVPTWITAWFIISGLLQFFDTAFLLLRPRSLANGDLAGFFSFHNNVYLKADPSYGDLSEKAVWAQPVMNTIESAVALFAFVALRGGRRFALLAVVAAMSFWKTVSYFAFASFITLQSLENPLFWQVCLLPSTFWLWVPLCVIYVLLNRIDALTSTGAAAKKKQQ